VSNAGNRIKGMLSRVDEWRRHRLLLAVMIICGINDSSAVGAAAREESFQAAGDRVVPFRARMPGQF
jgi:hypothetical protein